jgi:hypothetical protein
MSDDPLGTLAAAVASEANREQQTAGAGAAAANSPRTLTWRDIRGTTRQ